MQEKILKNKKNGMAVLTITILVLLLLIFKDTEKKEYLNNLNQHIYYQKYTLT